MATVLTIIFGLIILVILSGLAYFLLFLPTRYLVPDGKRRMVRLILTPTAVILFLAYYIFVPAWSNDDVATIEGAEGKYTITLTGERLLMAHDPISALRRATYLDTFKIVVPRAKGIVTGDELPIRNGYYGMQGAIHIDEETLKIDLYVDNYDKKTRDPSGWNGTYDLKREDGL